MPSTDDHSTRFPHAHVHARATVADDASIAPGVVIGAQVEVQAGALLEANAVIGATGDHAEDMAATVVGRGARIGANATIAAGVTVGEGARVEAGSVARSDVPERTVVAGNPARITGYADTSTGTTGMPASTPAPTATEPGLRQTSVRGVTVHTFPVVPDLRGSLTVGEFGELEDMVPFVPHRYFMVYDVPNAEVRGEHAHWRCHQFLLCVSGSLAVVADDGTTREEIVLSDRSTGVDLPPLTWGVQYRYSADAVLLAFASDPYDPSDYIRDYPTFLEAARSRDATLS